ncbi:MAG: hypothetical protein WDZ91_00015 [Paenibacillaceae bacterium]
MKSSLRLKLIIGFGVVTIPMFIFLIYNNYYAMKVVRTQVGQSNKNLLSMYMNQIDSTFENIDSYLYSFIVKDTDLALYSQNNPDNNEYMISKVRLQNKMNTDLNNFKNADMFFIYSLEEHDLLSTRLLSSNFEKYESINKVLHAYMLDHEAEGFTDNRWKLIQSGGETALIRLVETEFYQVIGAWVDVSNLLIPLHLLDLGQQGQALIVSDEGVPLTKLSIEEMNKPGYTMTLPNENRESHRFLYDAPSYE